jgi:hypothetical protein
MEMQNVEPQDFSNNFPPEPLTRSPSPSAAFSDSSQEEPDIWWEPSDDNVHIILHIGEETTIIDYMSTNSLANAIILVSEFPNATDILRVLRYQYNFLLRNEI